MDFQEFFAERAVEAVHAAGGFELELVEENFAGERIPVGVKATGAHANDSVTAIDGCAIEDAGFFDNADDGAAESYSPGW